MIEDKKLGLKIAESENEGLWFKVVKASKKRIEATEEQIKNAEDALKVERKFLRMAGFELQVESLKNKRRVKGKPKVPIGVG